MENRIFGQKSVFFSKNQKSANDSPLKTAFSSPKRSFELKIPNINTKSTTFTDFPMSCIYCKITIFVRLQEKL